MVLDVNKYEKLNEFSWKIYWNLSLLVTSNEVLAFGK